MVCHSATGSLLLPAIGVLQHDRETDARCVNRPAPLAAGPGHFCYTTPLRSPGQPGDVELIARAFCSAKIHVIETSSQSHSRGNAKVNPSTHQPPQIARANGIELCYEIFGDPSAEPMILIMGLGAQMIQWDDDFCRQLAARGFRVVRFDNRDIGQSSRLSGGKPLSPLELLKLRFLKIPVKAPYRLSDMAEDTVGLMDALGIASAHLVGVSMGGMIAQEIAILFPQRLRSLTSIMSTTGNPKIPGPTREAMAVLMAPPPASRAEFLERFAKTWKVLRV